MKARVLQPLVVVASALLVLTACGSNGSGSSKDLNARVDAGKAKGTPIVIGMIGTAGSAEINTPDYVTAVKAGATALNAKGGIKGHPVDVTYCNDNADPNQAAACARQMVEKKVAGTVADLSSADPLTVAQVLDKGGVPQIGLLANTPFEFSCGTCFPYDANQIGVSAGVVQAIKQQGGKKLFIASLNIPQTEIIVDYAKRAAQALGIPTEETRFPFDQADYSPIAAKIKASGADWVYLPVGENNAIQLIRALRQIGSDVKFAMSTGVLTAADFKKLGDAAEGIVVFGGEPPFSSTDVPGVARFQRELAAAKKAGDSAADPASMTLLALQAWTSFQAWAQVAEGLDSWAPADILSGFKSAKDLDLDGINVPWSPGVSAGVPGLGSISNTHGWPMTVKNSELVATSDKPVDIGDLLK